MSNLYYGGDPFDPYVLCHHDPKEWNKWHNKLKRWIKRWIISL